jgi:hypothetical protein
MPNKLQPPKPDIRAFFSLMGLQYSGDVGDYTTYRTRHGRPVFFLRAPPAKPPSPLQVTQRARFSTAQGNWSLLGSEEKANWELICLKLSICVTGQNLYLHHALVRDTPTLQSAMNQTNVNVSIPTYVP